MADSKHPLKFLEGGVGMRLDVDWEFLRVEFAPVAPAVLGGQRSGLCGGQIAVNHPPPEIKAPAASTLDPPWLMNFTTRSRKSSARLSYPQTYQTMCQCQYEMLYFLLRFLRLFAANQ